MSDEDEMSDEAVDAEVAAALAEMDARSENARQTKFGFRTQAGDLLMFAPERVEVGEWLVPARIEVIQPSENGQPALTAIIEVRLGVPRLVGLNFASPSDAREIRTRDLRALDLETLVERCVASVAVPIGSGTELDVDEAFMAVLRKDEAAIHEGIGPMRSIRKGSRRTLTPEYMQRVARVYNAHDHGGLEAVMAAFHPMSKATAARHINAAREAGLIEKRKR